MLCAVCCCCACSTERGGLLSRQHVMRAERAGQGVRVRACEGRNKSVGSTKHKHCFVSCGMIDAMRCDAGIHQAWCAGGKWREERGVEAPSSPVQGTKCHAHGVER